MQNINVIPVPSNFIETPIFADEYVFGSNSKVQGTILRNDGDWREYIPDFEDQYKNGLETMSCTTYATLNAIEILLQERFRVSKNCSERFTSTLSGTTPSGNSPHKVAETIRTRGLIDETRLPFSLDIATREQYFAEIAPFLKYEGLSWLKDWVFSHDWVITRDTRKEEKNALLEEALKYSPVGVSVFGWADVGGVYTKTGNDNHWTLLIYGDADFWYVLDSYAPYIKRLEKNYDFGFAKRFTIERRAKSWLRSLFDKFIQ